MKKIKAETIIERLSVEIDKCLKNVDSNTVSAIERAVDAESSNLSKWAGEKILENAKLASLTDSYACQDTGLAIVFAKVGENVCVSGLTNAINTAVREGYKTARKSVCDPITRANTKDNTPAIIHYDIVSGDSLDITFLAKGAGSENVTRLYMLVPADGTDGIIDSVIDCVNTLGANACPPLTVGVGIGGSSEKACLNAKLALVREGANPRADLSELENTLLQKVNSTSIGMGGFGGDITALSVRVECSPTHIGMLPVCVCLNCHSVRHAHLVL